MVKKRILSVIVLFIIFVLGACVACGKHVTPEINDNQTTNNETTQQRYYSVVIDFDNGDEKITYQVTSGEKIDRPQDPVKITKQAEYKFLGWYKGGNLWDFETMAVTEDVTIIALWEVVSEYSEPVLPKK